MDPHEEAGLFFGLEDCKCLFRRLKKDEFKLSDEEQSILQRLEKMLYARLSIREIEDL